MRRARIPAWFAVAPTGFVLAWGGNHFTPLLHVYETVGGYAPWQANLLLGMYVVGLIPGMLLAAGLSDRHGRRAVAILGLAAAALGSVLLAASMTSFVLLCAGRVLAGIGVGWACPWGPAGSRSSPPPRTTCARRRQPGRADPR